MQGDDEDPDEMKAGDERTGDFAVDSLPPEEAAPRREGPPEKYAHGSWYDRARHDWWFDSEPDPCPVRPMGYGGGLYVFVSPHGEYRRFTSAQLHRAGGLSDLFAARIWWLTKHFPGVDKRTGEPTGRPNTIIAAEAMMRACVDAGYLSADIEHRLAGTWRGPDGAPIVHCGDVLIHNGEILKPGTRLGSPLYVIAGRLERPALETFGNGRARFAAVKTDVGHRFVAFLLNWTFQHDGGAELTAGFVAMASLGDAIDWRSHLFFRARPGAGKSTLMRLIRAALGGAAHDVATTYSAAFVEQHYRAQARAILLDENESDADPTRMKRTTELVKLLSDEGGAKGGRGGADGTARSLDVHGAVCMAATVRGQWKQQDKERISVVELDRFEGEGRKVATHDEINALIAEAEKLSPLLRARLLDRWELFHENVARARRRILELGGTARDGNQLGHLLAGWWTLISDEPAGDDLLDDIGRRFLRWIVSINDAREGSDPAMQCWNRLLGEDAHVWRGGETLTVGQVIARAREASGGESYRKAMLGMGLRLLPDDPTEKYPTWPRVNLCIANTHPGLETIFNGSDWSMGRWADVLPDLEFLHDDGTTRTKVSLHGPVRFGGPQSRGVVVPFDFLPSLKDEEP